MEGTTPVRWSETGAPFPGERNCHLLRWRLRRVRVLLMILLCGIPPIAAPAYVVAEAGAAPPGFEVLFTDAARGLSLLRGAGRAPGGTPLQDVGTHVATAAGGDPLRAQQWALDALRLPEAWSLQSGDPTLLVAIVDSGVRLDHPDLPAARVRKGPDLVAGDLEPEDRNGHGTHVAGIVAAETGNGVGIAGAANVTLYVVRVLDASGSGSCATVALGVLDAVEAGAAVINMSLSCSGDNPALALAVGYALSKGVTVVAAAGNLAGSDPPACVTYPARYAGVIAVGSVDDGLHVESSSCRGERLDVVAPGGGVLSTDLDGYASRSGTSMAAAHASGVAALVLSEAPGADVRALLRGTARDLGAPGHDADHGAGLVDAYAAVAAGALTRTRT